VTRPHADLRPTDFEIIEDQREKRPLPLVVEYEGKPTPLRVVPGTLQTGDLAVRHLERYCAIERKGLGDIVACCVGENRERFERELERSRGIDCFVLLIEASWASIELQQYRSKISPRAVIGSLYAWRQRYGFSLEMAGDRERAALSAARTLYAVAKDRWTELQAFYSNLKIAGGTDVAS
jgi:DNA excision repair protein ERCC-4